MVFKKMLRAFGVGGPSVDTVLAVPTACPGTSLTGEVHIQGGDHDVDIEHVALGLVTKVEVETQINGEDTEYDKTVEFFRLPVAGAFRLPSGARQSIPFQFPVPWETPITEVFGQHLHGMTMGLRTELSVARAVDKGDLDPVGIRPLDSQARVLDAFARLGFRFKNADLEQGRIRQVSQTLPFYQEIEFYASPRYAHAINEIEVTMVTDPQGVTVIVEADKRGGLFTSGRDVYHHFRVGHALDNTDLAAGIDAWFQQATGRR